MDSQFLIQDSHNHKSRSPRTPKRNCQPRTLKCILSKNNFYNSKRCHYLFHLSLVSIESCYFKIAFAKDWFNSCQKSRKKSHLALCRSRLFTTNSFLTGLYPSPWPHYRCAASRPQWGPRQPPLPRPTGPLKFVDGPMPINQIFKRNPCIYITSLSNITI